MARATSFGPARQRRLGRLVGATLLGGGLIIATGGVGTVGDADPAVAAAPDTNLVCSAGVRDGGPGDAVTVDLAPTEGSMQTPDGNSVYMWSFGVKPPAGPAVFQTPAPTICADEGDILTVTLTAPAGWPLQSGYDTPVSIIFPGQPPVTATGGSPGLFTNESSGGATVSYTFTAKGGTYLYEGGTDPELALEMGQYGALIVYRADGTAYGPGTGYDADREFLLVLHSVDPDLHAAMEADAGGPFEYVPEVVDYINYTGILNPPGTQRHPRYFTINGRSMPDTIAPNFAPWLPKQPYGALVQLEAQDPTAPGPPALVRYANASLDNHPFHPHGNHLQLIAQDGERLNFGAGATGGLETFTTMVGSGQTFDVLAQWLNVTDFDPDFNPVPITEPEPQDVVYKDDITWYSGSPYLGVTAQLPSPVTTFNSCGEYYFPWHSHALNEVQNFDEGFGGMHTLWRIDPVGGCS